VITTKISPPIGRGRGRPRGFDRDHALDTALKVFWRLGYEGASIADLTQAIGISPPSLYAAFGSKAKLYKEVLRRYAIGEGAFSSALANCEGSARDAVEIVLHECACRFVNPGHPPGCMISTAVLAYAEENEAVADHLAGLRRKAAEAFAVRIEAGIVSGELNASINSQAVARFYTSVIQGMSVQATDGADLASLHLIADMAMDAWPSILQRACIS